MQWLDNTCVRRLCLDPNILVWLDLLIGQSSCLLCLCVSQSQSTKRDSVSPDQRRLQRTFQSWSEPMLESQSTPMLLLQMWEQIQLCLSGRQPQASDCNNCCFVFCICLHIAISGSHPLSFSWKASQPPLSLTHVHTYTNTYG